jgi:LacI family transcriptional regulator
MTSTSRPSGTEPSRRRRGKAPTIFDVAAVAGVSKSTVSNVVRGADEVSEQTRARVLEAIARLQYTPNAIARQFVNQRTTNLGVLVGDLGNPYYAHMARVVERAAFGFGYTAMFCNIEGDDNLAAAGVDALVEQRVAGVVFLAFSENTPHLEDSLRGAAVPIVFLGLHERWADSVGPRDAEGGRLAAEHLLALGHERIAYMRTALVEPSTDRARQSGYRAALRHAGRAAQPTLRWEPGSPVLRSGREQLGVAELFRRPHAPTAVFVSNDIGAIALMEAVESAGIGVPADLSVVGFDDIAIAGLRRISLTTVAQPLDFQAEKAVAMLLERIERPSLPLRHVSVAVELRERGSTTRPRVG